MRRKLNNISKRGKTRLELKELEEGYVPPIKKFQFLPILQVEHNASRVVLDLHVVKGITAPRTSNIAGKESDNNHEASVRMTSRS